MCKMCHASAIQNKFWPPPSFKKLPEALIISPELRHLYIHTYIQTDTEDTNRNLDRLYITRPKRLGTSKRRHAILHVKNSVLPSAANSMVSCAIWKNIHSWVFQLKTSNCTRPSDSCNFDSLWKTYSCMFFFQIALETMLLLPLHILFWGRLFKGGLVLTLG